MRCWMHEAIRGFEHYYYARVGAIRYPLTVLRQS
jgi:hypothetical protein